MHQRAVLRAVLVDPSLFTAPYDAALDEGLAAAGVHTLWMTRPVRRGDRHELPRERTDAFYYRRTDQAAWVPVALRPALKGLAHLAGTVALLRRIYRARPDVVHVQWVVVPLIDAAAMALVRRWCPLVLTVHDTAPWNASSWVQKLGYRLPAMLAHQVIVHTRSGQESLRRGGVPEDRVSVVPHGPLALRAAAPAPVRRDARWTAVLFGEIKPYKGVDVLVEAVAALREPVRRRLRVVVAGRPRMDMAPLAARIAALGLQDQVALRLGRLSEEEMAALFAEADGFVFPYRQIDASGVYYLVKSLGRWLIASRVGIFAEDLEPARGALVPPGDALALARALEDAVERRPRGAAGGAGSSWAEIGRATRALYERARTRFGHRPAARRGAWQP